MWIAFAAASLVITLFIGKVSEALRKREQEALSLRDQAARDERLASIVTLAAGAAHELGTSPGDHRGGFQGPGVVCGERAGKSGGGCGGAPDSLGSGPLPRILQQMSVRGAEPVGETPVPLGLGEALGSVKQGFAPPERDLVRTEVAGEGRRWCFRPTPPGRRLRRW
jgi:two-component system sensor histidine kinase RegB